MIQCVPMEGSDQVKVIFTLQPHGRDRGAVSAVGDFNDEAADGCVSNEVGGVDSVLDLTYLRWARPARSREVPVAGAW